MPRAGREHLCLLIELLERALVRCQRASETSLRFLVYPITFFRQNILLYCISRVVSDLLE